MVSHHTNFGTPYAPHDEEDKKAMLDAIGVADVEELYSLPSELQYDGSFGIEPRSEQRTIQEVSSLLQHNEDVIEFLGRGHYTHYVPSLVDHLSDRSEFLTSYTQYQPEVSQGFLQALFEYQSVFSELTGLPVVNCSLNDPATALGEAARMAARVRAADGDTILIPETLPDRQHEVLHTYVDATGISVQSYAYDDGVTDPAAIEEHVDEDILMIYTPSPTILGTIEPSLEQIGNLASNNDALFCVGSDPVALSILESPASVGADIAIGNAGVLGMQTSYGFDVGFFATRDDFIRQLPGRLVGATTDADNNRAYTMVLQTRLQHIRRERATSNICTNAAWAALRSVMHAAMLGPQGLVNLASTCIEAPKQLADELDAIQGIDAPVHDQHHFREFVCRTEKSAAHIADQLLDEGCAVHVIDDHQIQICVTDMNREHSDKLVSAVKQAVYGRAVQ